MKNCKPSIVTPAEQRVLLKTMFTTRCLICNLTKDTNFQHNFSYRNNMTTTLRKNSSKN